MIKQLISYMGLMILCMLEIIMRIRILKEIMIFFVIKLLDIEMFARALSKPLKYSLSRLYLTDFNSLYRAPDSLY